MYTMNGIDMRENALHRSSYCKKYNLSKDTTL